MNAKALLSASIVVDHTENPRGGAAVPVRSAVKLYSEDGELVWRAVGPLGDEVEVLPRPGSVAQAKVDFAAVYPKQSTWRPRATWL
jgi:hypothetical protein